MTHFTKLFFISLTCMLLSLGGNAQNNPNGTPFESDVLSVSYNPDFHTSPVMATRAWNLQFNHPNHPNHTPTAGIETDGNFFYVTQWNNDTIDKYDTLGNYVGFFKIPGVSGLRDLAFDGTYFYGGSAAANIYEMDFTNHTLVSTITCPTGTEVRHIAYDDANDAFWVGNWSTDISLISRTGALVSSIPATTHGLNSIYGSAYDSISPGGPYLWAINANSGLDMAQIFMVNINTGEQTGIVYDVLPDLGYTSGLGGGLFTHHDIVSGTITLGGIVQSKAIFGYNLEQIIDTLDASVEMVLAPTTGQNLSTTEPVTCTIKNNGSQTLTGFSVTFEVYNDTLVSSATETFTSSILFGQTSDFTFNTTVDLSAPATYQVMVYTSVQGDCHLGNDTASSEIFSLNTISDKLVLVEHFTQASCGPCASQNPALDNLITNTTNIDRVVHIAYHTSWPGSDPMYDFNDVNGEGDARVDYYGVSGVPNCVLAGNQDQGLPSIVTQEAINDEYDRPGMFQITGEAIAEMSANTINVNVSFKSHANLSSGTFTGHVVLVEDVSYTSAPGSNGETEFPDVMRKMIPAVSGTDLGNPMIGDSTLVTYSYSIQSPVNPYNCKLICFAQREEDKEIFMATEIEVIVINAVEEVSDTEVSIYPNPSSGLFNISNIGNASITVFNIIGDVVAKVQNTNNNAVLDLSHCAKGAYFVRITSDGNITTKTIQITK